ncbi:MAG: hypothetical protein AAFO69_01830 [Bacteroidota bacterium]
MKIQRKILHVSMAIVLMVATTGFSMNKHYCMGSIKSMQVYFSQQHDHTDDACGGSERMMDCCDDEHMQLKVDELSKQTEDIHLGALDFAFTITEITPPEFLHLSDSKEDSREPDYLIPDPPGDLYVAHQVFLL